jgi:serine protease Do
MRMKSAFRILVLAGLPFAPLAAAQDAPADPHLLVFCYDEARQVVSREMASACRGTVVTEAQAKELQDKRTQAMGRAMMAHPQPSPPGTRMVSIGTGFVVDAAGKLVTNNHVIDGCTGVVIEPALGEPLAAKVQAVDVSHDLALLDTGVKTSAAARFRPLAPMAEGAFIATVGYPNMGLAPREPIVTAGTLGGPAFGSLARVNPSVALVMKADIHHGNSGGPIFDAYALVIGVMKAKLDQPMVYRETGKLEEDTGMGVQAAIVLDFLKINQVNYRIGQEGKRLDAPGILADARPIMARVDCYK